MFYVGRQTLIPAEVLELPNAATLLIPQHNQAISILGSATHHRQHASEMRIQPHASVISTSTNAKFTNLSKVAAVLAERRTKKIDLKVLDTKAGPKISVTLWSSHGPEKNFKLQVVCMPSSLSGLFIEA